MKTIGIFPASGALGTSTYTHLLKLIPHDKLILISRHPEKISQEHIQAGAQARRASYESPPGDLEAAFSGVEVLFLISYPSHVHEYRVEVQLPAVDAAVRAGVGHVFYSSLALGGPAASTSSKAVVMQAHLDTEAHLGSLAAQGKVTYTSVREGLYSESLPIYTAFFDPAAAANHQPGEILEVLIPHDGGGPGVAWARRDELGEATARLIAGFAAEAAAGQPAAPTAAGLDLVNRTVLLSGPKAWTLRETLEQLGSVVGREVRIREVSVDEYVSQPQVMAYFGDAQKARTWATAWEAIRDGEAAVVTDLLASLLRREPEGFDVTIRRQFA